MPLLDVVNVKGIVYHTGALEIVSKHNKLLELKKASLKDNTGSMAITFHNELTKQLNEGKCYEIIEARITEYMTQRLLKTTKFTEILEIEDNSFQLTDDGLNLHRNSFEGKIASFDVYRQGICSSHLTLCLTLNFIFGSCSRACPDLKITIYIFCW